MQTSPEANLQKYFKGNAKAAPADIVGEPTYTKQKASFQSTPRLECGIANLVAMTHHNVLMSCSLRRGASSRTLKVNCPETDKLPGGS